MKLNILNIGCGGRVIHKSLIQLDFQRDLEELNMNGHIANSLISDMSELPFKDNTIDGIIALHILEHSEDPVNTLKEWLRVLKPGKKIGIILPNFKYTWSASNDNYIYGHKWNSEPLIFKELLEKHFPSINIIKFNTLEMKQSFNIIIQKDGNYLYSSLPKINSGFDLDKGEHKDVGYYYHNNEIYLDDSSLDTIQKS